MSKGIEIVWFSKKAEIEKLVTQGYEVVDSSVDHPADAALRAYRDRFGVRKNDPRFVVTGAPTAISCFIIAALSGRLPHTSRVEELMYAPVGVMNAGIKDLSRLAQWLDLNKDPAVENAAKGSNEWLIDNWAFYSSNRFAFDPFTWVNARLNARRFQRGVEAWRDLLGRPSPSGKIQRALRRELLTQHDLD